jgi:integrase
VRDHDNAFKTQGKGKDGADLLKLLAYSGCRLHEATESIWTDINEERGCFTVTGGERGTKNHECRTVPMTPALKELLLRLREQKNPQPTDSISSTNDAKKYLQSATRKLNLPHISHHDLGHFFAATCIESGVDIPTISRWLGHKHGDALAMKVYGHLRIFFASALSWMIRILNRGATCSGLAEVESLNLHSTTAAPDTHLIIPKGLNHSDRGCEERAIPGCVLTTGKEEL